MNSGKSLHRRARLSQLRRGCRYAVEEMERRILLSTYTVNTLADRVDPAGSPTMSVRDAIALAAGNPGDDTILIPAGDYQLTMGGFDINDTSGKLTLQATGGGAVFDGTNQSTILSALTIESGANVAANNLAITGGNGGVNNLGTLLMNGCTVYDNNSGYYLHAGDGGGIDNVGTAVLINCTIDGNQASDASDFNDIDVIFGSGGGISNSGTLSIFDSTITDNSASFGSGISSSGSLTIANSIISQNAYNDDVSGSFTASGPNLIGGDARLSPLAFHGGPTPTDIPMAGSAAVGAGSVAAIPAGIVADQRGLPRVVNGKVDLGAVQSQGPATIKLTSPAKMNPAPGGVTSVPLGSFTASSTAGPYFVIVNWGDGTSDGLYTFSDVGSIPTQTHNYIQVGVFQTLISMTDGAGDLSNVVSFPVSIVGRNIVVNTLKDQTDPAGSKTVSLPDAINIADEMPTTITFDPNVFASRQTITLTQSQLGTGEYNTTILGPAAGLTLTTSTQNPTISVGGVATFEGLTFSSGGQSGAIDNSGSLTMVDCDLFDVAQNPAIDNGGTATLINCTLSRNDNPILNYGTMTLNDCTISGNLGPVDNPTTSTYYGSYGGTLIISNSIVAGNSDSDISGPVESLGHNIIGNADDSGDWISSDLTGTAAAPLDPKLGLLGFNGGPTATFVPLPGSPAIGAGDPSLIPPGDTTDQRGVSRTVNGKLDIGSVQTESSAVIKIKPAATQNVTVDVAHTFSLGTFTATPTNGPFSVSIDWGDGSTSSFTVASPGALGTKTHSFNALGDLNCKIGVADKTGNFSQIGFVVHSSVAALQKIIVNTTSDQSDPAGSLTVSLRDALARAANFNGPAEIDFDPHVFASSKKILLGDNFLDIGGDPFSYISIKGPAAPLTILEGGAGAAAITIEAGATAFFTNLTFSYSQSNEIENRGTLSLSACTVINSDAAGISNDGTMTITSSTIANNAMDGVDNGVNTMSADSANLTMINTTVAANSGSGVSNSFLGHYSNAGQVSLTNCTVSDISGTTITLSNSIVTGNVSSYVYSQGYNLFCVGAGTYGSGPIASDLVGSYADPIDPRLAPLGNYGGPTQTMVPFANSPAIGAGSIALLPPNVQTDQRGFPRTLNGSVDIGAVQTQSGTITITPPAALAVTGGATVSVPLGSFSTSTQDAPYLINIVWGDGTPGTMVTQSSAGAIPPIAHAFMVGTFTGTISIIDGEGNLSNITSFTVNSVPPPAQTIIVNTIQDQTDAPDSGIISLRDALAVANAAFGPVAIVFDPSVFATSQTIALTDTLYISINSCPLITITAPPSGLTISAPTDAYYCDMEISSTASISGIIFSGGGNQGTVVNGGTLSMNDCNVFGNTSGSGINNFQNGSLTLTNSTVSGDTGYDGGALYNSGSLTVFDCTIDGNSAAYGGGIFNRDGARCTIANSIIAGNAASAGGNDVYGTFTSLGNNFIGNVDGSLGWTASDITGTTAAPLNPHLGALGLNGGTTATFIPQPGSLLIDAGSNTLVPTGITTDENGNPRIADGVVDIGAVETPAPPTPLNFSASVEDRFSNPYPGTIPADGKIRVTLTNIGHTRESGHIVITLYTAGDDSVLDGTQLGKAFHENIRGVDPKHPTSLNLNLKNLPDLAVGNYRILAQVTGSMIGGIGSVVAVGTPLVIQAVDGGPPSVHFIDHIAGLSRTAKEKHRMHVVLDVTDAGNISAKGTLEIDLNLSTDPGGANPVPLATLMESVNIAPTRRVVLDLSLTFPAGITPGNYYLTATVDPQDTFGASATDTAVSAEQLKVLHSATPPPKHHAK